MSDIYESECHTDQWTCQIYMDRKRRQGKIDIEEKDQ